MAANKQTDRHTHTRAQCSHASVGLAQARPNKHHCTAMEVLTLGWASILCSVHSYCYELLILETVMVLCRNQKLIHCIFQLHHHNQSSGSLLRMRLVHSSWMYQIFLQLHSACEPHP